MKSISIESGIVPPIVCMPTGIRDWLEIGGITGMLMIVLLLPQLQLHNVHQPINQSNASAKSKSKVRLYYSAL